MYVVDSIDPFHTTGESSSCVQPGQKSSFECSIRASLNVELLLLVMTDESLHDDDDEEEDCFVEYLYYYVRWCASLQPPTICAKSSSAYNA
jgi:hypothetical protein